MNIDAAIINSPSYEELQAAINSGIFKQQIVVNFKYNVKNYLVASYLDTIELILLILTSGNIT